MTSVSWLRASGNWPRLVAVAAILAGAVAWALSTATAPQPSATGRLGVDPREEPSAFRDAIRFRQEDIINHELGNHELGNAQGLLTTEQSIAVSVRPNLTYLTVVVSGPDEAEAVAAVDSVMGYLIDLDQEERRSKFSDDAAEWREILADQEAARQAQPSGSSEATGLGQAIADTIEQIEELDGEAATTNSSLEVVTAGFATTEQRQSWLAALSAFAGTMLVGLALGQRFSPRDD